MKMLFNDILANVATFFLTIQEKNLFTQTE